MIFPETETCPGSGRGIAGLSPKIVGGKDKQCASLPLLCPSLSLLSCHVPDFYGEFLGKVLGELTLTLRDPV